MSKSPLQNVALLVGSIVPGETREFPKLELVAIIRNSTCYCINTWDTHGDGSKPNVLPYDWRNKHPLASY